MAKVAKRHGRYVLDFYDNQGKRKRQTLKKDTTLKQAKTKLREIEDKLSKGIWIPSAEIPTFEKVAEDWLEYKKPNLRRSTWKVYEGHTKFHFEDIKHLKINRVTIQKIEKWIADRQKADMNISTLRKILVTFNQIMSYAVRHQYITYNPLRDAERPRRQGKEGKGVPKIRVLAPEEINALLDAVKSQKYRVLFKLAIMSGARQGELFGLKWSDLDWENSQVHIQRTFNNQAWYDVKTETSRRKIDLGPSMIAELKKWKLACPFNKLNLVFPNEAGQPFNHNNVISRYFDPALKDAGIERIRFHDLRHTYASLLIEQGENIKYIQTQLGHSSPTVTLNIYAHLMKKVNQEAACRLENAIFNA
jgi:integrase